MKPEFTALAAGFFYLMLSGVMLYFGFKKSPTLNLWVGASILTALIGYFITRKEKSSKWTRRLFPEEVTR